MGLKFPLKEHSYFYASARSRTTEPNKSKKSENCGRQNMPRPYLKIWEWEWIFGRAVKAISSPRVCSPCARYIFNFLKANDFLVGPLKLPTLTKLNVKCITFSTDISIQTKSQVYQKHTVKFSFISEKGAWDNMLHMSESNWESLLVYKAN